MFSISAIVHMRRETSPNANQSPSKTELRHSHAVSTPWMCPPIVPCPTLSALAEPVFRARTLLKVTTQDQSCMTSTLVIIKTVNGA